MRAGRFFRNVWRINALAILLIVAAALAGIGWAVVSDIARHLSRQKTPAEVRVGFRGASAQKPIRLP